MDSRASGQSLRTEAGRVIGIRKIRSVVSRSFLPLKSLRPTKLSHNKLRAWCLLALALGGTLLWALLPAAA